MGIPGNLKHRLIYMEQLHPSLTKTRGGKQIVLNDLVEKEFDLTK